MSLKLVYQKVYLKQEEWQNVVTFFQDAKINSFLLSKNIFLSALREFKSNIVGDCLLVEYPEPVFDLVTINKLLDFISTVKKQYTNKLYLIGFLLVYKDNYYFLNLNQLETYMSYYDYKKNKKEGYTLNVLLLSELYKTFACLELNKKLNLMAFNLPSNLLLHKYSYYY